jgi:hypothetical protein
MKEFDKALSYIELSDALYEVANKQGETNFWKVSMGENFFWKDDCFRKAGRTEDTLRVLSEQVDFVINVDNETRDQLNEVWYLNQMKSSGLKRNMSQCERILGNLKHCKKYDKLRSQPEFNNLIVKLEKELLGKAQEIY